MVNPTTIVTTTDKCNIIYISLSQLYDIVLTRVPSKQVVLYITISEP